MVFKLFKRYISKAIQEWKFEIQKNKNQRKEYEPDFEETELRAGARKQRHHFVYLYILHGFHRDCLNEAFAD